jgi:DNA-binding transcriptional regulator YdaS (Cro superfamily)
VRGASTITAENALKIDKATNGAVNKQCTDIFGSEHE